eukprot:575778_1
MTELQLDIIPSSKPEVRNQKSIDEFDSHPRTQTLNISQDDSRTFPHLFSIGRNISTSFKALPTMKDIKDLFQAPNHIKTAATLQTDSFYHIDPNKHCQIFRGYVRQDWDTINVEHGSEELRAGWIDILFDLIFVACVVHLATEAVYSIPSDDAHRRLASSTTVQHAAFQVSYACLRFISTLIYLKAFLIPRARLHSLWN